jgi:hypothetical protein
MNRIFWPLASGLIFFAGCGDQADPLLSEEFAAEQQRPAESEEGLHEQGEHSAELFRHPLVGAPIYDGRVAGVDIHDDPTTGERFAVGEITSQLEGQASPHSQSGVFRFQISEASPESLLPKDDVSLDSRFATAQSRQRIGPRLMSALDSNQFSQPSWVRVRLVDDYRTEHIWTGLERAIGLGRVNSARELSSERADLMHLRREAKRAQRQPLVEELYNRGLEVRALENLNALNVRVTAEDVAWLASRNDVESIRLVVEEGTDDSCPEIQEP